VICRADALVDGGDGVRFEVCIRGQMAEAFAIRFGGRVYAYMNRCAHVPVELDWNPGKFFDADGTALLCSTHGAAYDPATGRCLGGPCRRRGLDPVAVHEHDGMVVIAEQEIP